MTAITPAPGIYPGVPMELYHAWDCASNSRLSRLRQSPAHLKAYLEQPPEERSALVIGRAAHATILEPETFDSVYTVAGQCTAIKKDKDRCSNGGTSLHSELGWLCGVHGKGLHAGFSTTQFVLPEAMFSACRGMRNAVHAHKAASALLAGMHDAELSVVWNDAETGVSCKARFDGLARQIADGTILDVKTTTDASERAFERSIFSWGYHRQAAFYLDAAAASGIEARNFVIIAVEKEPPYAVAVYRLTEGAIDAGRDQLRIALARYAECTARNEWPGYPDEVRDIAIPAYAWAQIGEEVAA